MFTQPAPSPPTLATTTSPASPTRPSRLRGLSYLRNYTHNHLHSRDSSGGNSAHRLSLTRTTSYPPPTSTPTASEPVTSVTPAVRSPTQQTHSNLQRTAPETGEGTASSQDKSGPTSGWLPTVGGRSGVSRIATQSQSTPTTSSPALLLGNSPVELLPSAMGRTRSENSQIIGENGASQPNGTSSTDIGLPSIRFSQHQDVRAPRPSLVFSAMSRTLPTGREIIRVGRYSERESQQNPASNVPSAAPVGFKSKVVSRRHCEFWYEDGAWYIKDVRSSSGTFLNHVRLSSPGTESKPFPVKDGDIVQLGIDFKGGEEMIFRCVKIRVELNRGWQNSLNSFNVASHKRLRKMAKQGLSTSSSSSQDCTICLGAVAPCQSLFVAPCSHTWHYKCVRRIINGPLWPQFICPNCRAVADLEADVDDPFPDAEWEEVEAEDAMEENAFEAQRQEQNRTPTAATPSLQLPASNQVTTTVQAKLCESGSEETTDSVNELDPNLEREVGSMSISDHPVSAASAPGESNSSSVSVNICSSRPNSRNGNNSRKTGDFEFDFVRADRTPSPSEVLPSGVSPGPDGPMTPRNDAGPFVFDGSAGRTPDAQMPTVNLAEAADTSS